MCVHVCNEYTGMHMCVLCVHVCIYMYAYVWVHVMVMVDVCMENMEVLTPQKKQQT